jgi:hypothetical protein
MSDESIDWMSVRASEWLANRLINGRLSTDWLIGSLNDRSRLPCTASSRQPGKSKVAPLRHLLVSLCVGLCRLQDSVFWASLISHCEILSRVHSCTHGPSNLDKHFPKFNSGIYCTFVTYLNDYSCFALRFVSKSTVPQKKRENGHCPPSSNTCWPLLAVTWSAY